MVVLIADDELPFWSDNRPDGLYLSFLTISNTLLAEI